MAEKQDHIYENISNKYNYFEKQRSRSWGEFYRKESSPRYQFNEINRSRKFITLHDRSRNIKVRLPVNGGLSMVDYSRGRGWQSFIRVEKRCESDECISRRNVEKAALVNFGPFGTLDNVEYGYHCGDGRGGADLILDDVDAACKFHDDIGGGQRPRPVNTNGPSLKEFCSRQFQFVSRLKRLTGRIQGEELRAQKAILAQFPPSILGACHVGSTRGVGVAAEAANTTRIYGTKAYNAGEKTYNTSKKHATKGYNTAKKYGTQGYNATKKTATKGYDTTKKYASKGYDATKKTATKGYNTTKKYASKGYEATKHTANKAYETLSKPFSKNKSGKTMWRVDIDSCHSDLSNTGTKNKITVEFWSGNKFVGSRTKHKGISDRCNSSDEKFTYKTNKKITSVVVKTNGTDAFFIDELYLYKNSKKKKKHGSDNGRGWCLSKDKNDAKSWMNNTKKCKSQITFKY